MNRLVTTRCFYLVHLCLLLSSTVDASGGILWRDDFDGTQLNTNYWGYDLGGGGWGNAELQTYTTGAVSVSGGLLNIRAERINNGFTSGRIKTDGKMMFQYGTVEARIKIPDSDAGLWPAFWTLGMNFNDVGWPRSGEIDIMEIGQGLAITEGVVNRRVISGAHWEFEENLAAYALWKTFNVDLNEDFHIYKLEWTPTSLSTYVDGVRVWEMDIDAANCVDCEEFQQPHFLVLNLAVGGYFTSTGGSGSSSSGGSSSSSSCSSSVSSSSSGCGEPRIDVSAPLPADMQVDWIQILDNGFTQVFPTPAPTQTPSLVPTTSLDRSGSLSTKAPTKRPTPNPTPSVVTALSTKSPTRRPTPNPTPPPTPNVSRVGQLSTKNPTRRPTPNPTPRPPTRNPTPRPTSWPTPWVFQPVGYNEGGKGKGGGPVNGKGSTYYNYGKGGKGNYGKGATYYDYGKGKGGKGGKGGKSSKKSSSSSSDSYDYSYYGKGKGGKGSSSSSSSSSSSKGSKRSASYTYYSSALNTEAAASGVSQDATVHQTTCLTILSLALMLMA